VGAGRAKISIRKKEKMKKCQLRRATSGGKQNSATKMAQNRRRSALGGKEKVSHKGEKKRGGKGRERRKTENKFPRGSGKTPEGGRSKKKRKGGLVRKSTTGIS